MSLGCPQPIRIKTSVIFSQAQHPMCCVRHPRAAGLLQLCSKSVNCSGRQRRAGRQQHAVIFESGEPTRTFFQHALQHRLGTLLPAFFTGRVVEVIATTIRVSWLGNAIRARTIQMRTREVVTANTSSEVHSEGWCKGKFVYVHKFQYVLAGTHKERWLGSLESQRLQPTLKTLQHLLRVT